MKKRAGLVTAIAVVALLIVGVTGTATIQQRGGGAGDDTTGDNMPMGTTFAGIPIPGAAQPKGPGADAGEKETPDVVPGGDDPRGLDEFPVGVTPEGEPYHEGLVQVTFRRGVDEERIRAVCAEEGCAVRDMWKGTASPKKLTFVSASVLDGSSAEEKIAGFEQHDEVRSAGRSPVISFGSGEVGPDEPDGPDEPEGPGDPAFDQPDLGEYYLGVSGFTAAFDEVGCGGGVTVAVVDTGAPVQGLADLSQNVYYARASDDARYLSHDASGEPSPVGCAFSQGGPPDLSAPVTAVYGHSFAAGPLAFTTRCSPARSLIA